MSSCSFLSFFVSSFLGWFSFFSSSLSEMSLSVNSAANDKSITLAKCSSLLFLQPLKCLGGQQWLYGLNQETHFITNCICWFTDGRFNEEKLDIPFPLAERIL